MPSAYFSTVESVLIALLMGVCIGLSVRKQHVLWIIAQIDVTKSPVFERITYAGLSTAILFGAAVMARTVSNLDRYDFLAIFFVGAIATWLLAMRSNNTIERDARKAPRPPHRER